MIRRLTLVRHGHVENPLGCAYGRLPGFGLSATGRLQAAAAARRLRSEPLQRLYVSPLQRARETAEILNAGRGLPICIDERLIEWEGHGHGETPQEVFDRVGAFWNAWKSGSELSAAVVSHRDPIRALLIGLFRGREWAEMDNLNVFPLSTGGIYQITLDALSDRLLVQPVDP